MADLQRYLFISEENALTAALWVAHANLFHEFEHTPRLVITAPLKACGKTVLLNVLATMTNHSIPTGKCNSAAFVRLSAGGHLSFFMDEADMLFGKFGGDRDMITALNNGWQKGGNFIKCVGDTHVPTQMPVHSAVAMAGISLNLKLPDTTLSRSIVINMQRAKSDQLQEKYRRKRHQSIFRQHGEELLRWCDDHRQQIIAHDPMIPDSVEPRDEDKWESLVSIAQLASPELGVQAMRLLMSQRQVDEDEAKMMLLKDFKAVYDWKYSELSNDLKAGMTTKGIQPNALAIALCQIHSFEENNDQVWERWNAGKYFQSQDVRIKGHQVTTLLKEFGLFKASIRHEGSSQTFKGFKWDEMLSAYEQWIVPSHDEDYVPGEDWGECSHVVDYTTTRRAS
jgi:putative DNA primase/helicase